MSVSGQDVLHIAALARLEIAPERVSTLVNELNGILAHMDVLQGVDMAGVAAAASGISLAPTPTTLRADVPGAVQLERDRSEFAPASRDGFFLVPRLSTHE